MHLVVTGIRWSSRTYEPAGATLANEGVAVERVEGELGSADLLRELEPVAAAKAAEIFFRGEASTDALLKAHRDQIGRLLDLFERGTIDGANLAALFVRPNDRQPAQRGLRVPGTVAMEGLR